MEQNAIKKHREEGGEKGKLEYNLPHPTLAIETITMLEKVLIQSFKKGLFRP